MDGRDYGFEKDVNYEVYYTKLRMQGQVFGMVQRGIITTLSQIEDTPLSNVKVTVVCLQTHHMEEISIPSIAYR